jgi:hypothetical protein
LFLLGVFMTLLPGDPVLGGPKMCMASSPYAHAHKFSAGITILLADISSQRQKTALCPPVASPPPWSVEELEACFVVKDSAGQKLAYIYYEDAPARKVS